MSAKSVVTDYQTKLEQIHVGVQNAEIAQRRALSLIWAALGLSALLLFSASPWRISVWLCVLPVPAVAAAARWYVTSRSRWLRLLRLRNFYESALGRVEDRWHGTGFTGEEFRVANHVYDSDLQILGTGSLFEILCTARTGLGRRRLAEYLLSGCDLDEALERQESVRELKTRGELREQIALLGKYEFQESTWDGFSEWLRLPPLIAPTWVRILAFASSAALGSLIFTGFVTQIPLGAVAPGIPPLLVINLAIAGHFRKRTASLNSSARLVGVEIGVAREGIELIAAQSFQSRKLCSIKTRLQKLDAASSLRKLERLTNALTECDKLFFDLPSQALIIRTQLCFAIEEWRLRHADHLRVWFEAWAEFEALASISGYAWEHPDDPFPEFENSNPTFVAQSLGHPLIPSKTCVRNDVAFGTANRFYVVSGSNMSGKSTLMRSIGLNVVLARAGAPVRAVSLRLSSLAVFASLSIVDTMLEGKSRFFAEVERVRQTLETARNSPVLFLIDEILSGTNSRDRRIASEAIVRELVAQGAIGLLSTHDLALTEIAELDGLGGLNVHMGSRSGDDAMGFDYLLKPGVTSESNALAIAAMMGVPI